MQKYYYISYNKKSIQLLIKKNKLSKNYKLTFDKKNLRGLVSIPNYVSFKSGLEFANENVKWLYKEINKILPLVLIKHNTSLLIMGKRMKIIFEEDNFNKVYIKNNKIIIVSYKDGHKKIFKKWIVRRILNQDRLLQ